MKKRINIRDLIIIILCITIICMAIGFGILSSHLNSHTDTDSKYAVSFTKITPRTPVQGGVKAPTSTASLTNSNLTINFSFTLSNPKDEVSYRITIKNTGNTTAEIIGLIEVPDYTNDELLSKNISPVTIKHNNIIGKVIGPNETIELNVAATYSSKALKSETKTVPYQITLLTKSKE